MYIVSSQNWLTLHSYFSSCQNAQPCLFFSTFFKLLLRWRPCCCWWHTLSRMMWFTEQFHTKLNRTSLLCQHTFSIRNDLLNRQTSHVWFTTRLSPSLSCKLSAYTKHCHYRRTGKAQQLQLIIWFLYICLNDTSPVPPARCSCLPDLYLQCAGFDLRYAVAYPAEAHFNKKHLVSTQFLVSTLPQFLFSQL